MIVNGQLQQHIEIADRAFQYGDGCFTTMAARDGYLEFFAAHLKRLELACKTLNIEFKKWQELERCVLESLGSSGDCVVKVIITRGIGGRGYSPAQTGSPNYIISHHPIPEHYPAWQNTGISVSISPIKLACQPLLAGIKHLNRLEQVLVKQALLKTGFDDTIVCDTNNQIVESSAGNLFWFSAGVWFTPCLMDAGVEGVMRNFILDVAKERNTDIQVVKATSARLFAAEDLFICNSLMKIVPVKKLVDPTLQQRKDYPMHQSKIIQADVQQKFNLKACKI